MLKDSRSAAIRFTAEKCIDCNNCLPECRFLTDNGTPASIATKALSSAEDLNLAAAASYDCSMCGLCSAVCPVQAAPAAVFSSLRDHAQREGLFDLNKYSPLLSYEKTGRKFPFAGKSIPQGCHTAFFPGCTLPALFPKAVRATMSFLRSVDPSYGIIFNCCSKPSKMLGLQDSHKRELSTLVRDMEQSGIKRILTGCPNCHITLKEIDPCFEIISVYEELAKLNFSPDSPYIQNVTIHDPCAIRFEETVQESVRQLLTAAGVGYIEMTHHKQGTICCGEGGATHFNNPSYAETWSNKRVEEAVETGLPMISYCAGCVNFLTPKHPTAHLLDLLMVKRKSPPKLPGFPINYLNRLSLRLKSG